MQKENHVTKILTTQGWIYFCKKLMEYATDNIQEGKELLVLQYTRELLYDLNSDPELICDNIGYCNFEIVKKHVKEYKSKVEPLKNIRCYDNSNQIIK